MHQFRTLALLRQGPQRVSDIAARLGIRLSAATSFVDRLETKRLVERVHDATDRRVVKCQLTPLGRKEADSLWRINREWLEGLSQSLTDAELHVIIHAFEILAGAIERQNPPEERAVP
jgi:DNA-binding MarR family transcriptional regulator